MKTWKKMISILAILTIMVTACTPKNETQQETQTEKIIDVQPQPQIEVGTTATHSEAPQFVYPVEFNGETIPITVFYSITGADGEMMNLDRLVLMYGNTEQTIYLSSKIIEASTPESVFSYYILSADYNFDGFLDFAIHDGHSSNWEPDIMYKIFLYNQQTKSYSLNKELSELPNIRINNETQTIFSDDGPVTSEYKWINGKLELIESVSQFFSGPQ